MLISVIVPCYNQSDFIAECLNSVLAQRYNDWECLVIDDGSADDTAAIVNGFCKADPRFRLYTKPNGGVSSARNYGISKACGYLILPLDGDDKIGPDYLFKAQQVFVHDTHTTLVYAKADMFGSVNAHWALLNYDYEKLLFQNCIYCSAFFKKEDYFRTDGYDEQMQLGYEDWEFWIALLNPGSKVIQLDSIEFFYRRRANSRNTFKDDDAVHATVIDYIFKKHYSKYLAAAGLDGTMDSFRNMAELIKKHKEFRQSLTYKTLYKLEKEFRRFIKRYI